MATKINTYKFITKSGGFYVEGKNLSEARKRFRKKHPRIYIYKISIITKTGKIKTY